MTRKLGDLSCADCGKPMWIGKGTLPQGQARCRACRSADVPPAVECPRCATPLTLQQRKNGGRFCSRRCAYLQYVGSEHRGKRDYKRQRLLGGIRPVDVSRDPDGFPLTPVARDDAYAPLAGPLRLLWITRREYTDGRIEIRCPGCCSGAEQVMADEAWCPRCGVSVYIHPPQVHTERPRKPVVAVQVEIAVQHCATCSSPFMSTSGQQQRRYCNRSCADRYYRQHRPKPDPKPGFRYECACCGLTCESRNTNARYCSPSCKKRAEKRRSSGKPERSPVLAPRVSAPRAA